MKDVQEKLAAALISQKIGNDKCEQDFYEIVDLIIEFYSKSCKWEDKEVCTNHDSKWCADFVDNVKCGSCPEYEVNFPT